MRIQTNRVQTLALVFAILVIGDKLLNVSEPHFPNSQAPHWVLWLALVHRILTPTQLTMTPAPAAHTAGDSARASLGRRLPGGPVGAREGRAHLLSALHRWQDVCPFRGGRLLSCEQRSSSKVLLNRNRGDIH